DRQPHRARTSGAVSRATGKVGEKNKTCGRDFSGLPYFRSAWRLLRRPQSRPAHFPHGTLFVAPGSIRFSETQQHYSGIGAGISEIGRNCLCPGPWRRAAGPRNVSRISLHKKIALEKNLEPLTGSSRY